MRANLIPRLWDNGKVAGIAADTPGMLRRRPPFDEAPAREIEFAKGAVRCPTLPPPFHVSPGIDTVDVTALLHELASKVACENDVAVRQDALRRSRRRRATRRSAARCREQWRNHRQNNRPVIR
jgi:hypothetical protein